MLIGITYSILRYLGKRKKVLYGITHVSLEKIAYFGKSLTSIGFSFAQTYFQENAVFSM